jgi:UDP-3-O-[3-hydroxymyristoyl] glucosamine N-acyltransferase
MIGGQVGIVGHLTIGDNVKIAAQSGVGSNLKDDTIVQGSPAFEVGNYRRSYVSFRRLPETIQKIERALKDLKKG